MDVLCRSCQGLLGFTTESRPKSNWKKADINFMSWYQNAMSGSCHLCTLTFNAGAGPEHESFINNNTTATYELSGHTFPDGRHLRDIIDTNGDKYKFLAIVDKIKEDDPRGERIRRCSGARSGQN